MNPHILMVIDNQMNPSKYSVDELKANAADAANAYAVYEAADATVYAAAYTADYWLNKYFDYSGENKQDYIDAINNVSKMNPCILMVVDHQMNPEKYSKDELKANADAAAYADVVSYATTAYSAAYAAYASADDITNLINQYFNCTGENKQDYIDAINKLTTK